jgi:hypothetical protein
VWRRGRPRAPFGRRADSQRRHTIRPESRSTTSRFDLTERRGRDLNPRRTQRPVTVFEICSAGLCDYFVSALASADPRRGPPGVSHVYRSRYARRRRARRVAAHPIATVIASSVRARNANGVPPSSCSAVTAAESRRPVETCPVGAETTWRSRARGRFLLRAGRAWDGRPARDGRAAGAAWVAGVASVAGTLGAAGAAGAACVGAPRVGDVASRSSAFESAPPAAFTCASTFAGSGRGFPLPTPGAFAPLALGTASTY